MSEKKNNNDMVSKICQSFLKKNMNNSWLVFFLVLFILFSLLFFSSLLRDFIRDHTSGTCFSISFSTFLLLLHVLIFSVVFAMF